MILGKLEKSGTRIVSAATRNRKTDHKYKENIWECEIINIIIIRNLIN